MSPASGGGIAKAAKDQTRSDLRLSRHPDLGAAEVEQAFRYFCGLTPYFSLKSLLKCDASENPQRLASSEMLISDRDWVSASLQHSRRRSLISPDTVLPCLANKACMVRSERPNRLAILDGLSAASSRDSSTKRMMGESRSALLAEWELTIV